MAFTQKIKKRNGQIVDFHPEKITTAIGKAFLAVLREEHKDDAQAITRTVVEAIERTYGVNSVVIPGVEDIQDMVENALMSRGYFSVAKHYIIYRYEHSKEREAKKEEVQRLIQTRKLSVTKSDGRIEPFMLEKVHKTLSYVTHGEAAGINQELIIKQVEMEVYDGITTADIHRTLIMVVRSMIEQDPAYSVLASRLLLQSIYKETMGGKKINYANFEADYRRMFVENLKRAVELKKLSADLLSFNLDEIAAMLDPKRDDLFRYLGLQTLADRYFVRVSEKGQTLESPQYFWLRVAMGLALGEKPENRMRWIKEFYDVLSNLDYVASTPTLFNAGAPLSQLSSCYLNTVMDDLENIFKVYGDNAQLSKWTGGIGTDWTNLRATGALIKKAGIHSQGVIPFLKIANDVTVAINRSGRRRGATCAYLETWHYDIEEFLELRKNTGDERRRTHDMNTANWIPDLFMKRIREDGDWTLFSPDEVPELHHLYGRAFENAYVQAENRAASGQIVLSRKIKARDLWKKMLTQLFETGHPWVTFKDPSNIRSPQDHVGVVHNSNLCTEITLNTSETETAVCNLGSVNFARHIKNGAFDGEKVARTVKTAMRMLDNVIDINYYPTAEAKNSNLKHRPVGLGIMGFQDALYQLGISFASPECVDFADRSMEIVSYYAILGSSELARERGAYESYKGSKWDRGIFPIDTIALLEAERGEQIPVSRTAHLDWSVVRTSVKANGMRNSNCMAIAPTATISNISGCTAAIEPIYKNIYVKSNISGDFTVVNPYLIEDLKRIGLWDSEMLGKIKYHDGSIAEILEIPEEIRAKYKETFEIDMQWLIKAAAERGKWIDQSQSLNIFFRGQSGKDLSDIYFYAWNMGLKTTYYLRTLAASQVEKSTVNSAEYGSTHTRKKDTAPSDVASPAEPVQAPAAAPAELMAKAEKPAAVVSKVVTPSPITVQASVPVMASASPAPHQQQIMQAPADEASTKPKYTITKIGDAVCEACE
jgi:ribonucleoside-diphosphate reductase alpha chain